jgi:hypothetical protein
LDCWHNLWEIGLRIDRTNAIPFKHEVRTAEGAKHEAKALGDRKALQQRLRELAVLAIAAMKKQTRRRITDVNPMTRF